MIKVDAAGLEGKALSDAVDEDLAAFDEFFRNELKNETLSRYERAAIKTYLFWKTRGEAR